jgi:dethiobiotin synthetase
MTAQHHAFFLTGTDTDVGKTFIACALLHAWRIAGLSAVGYKPVAAGAELIDGRLCNDDAIRLQAAGTPGFALERINPLCLPEAIAPHLAAAHRGVSIDIAQMAAHFESLRQEADRVIVEGAGGFIVPLDEQYDMAQFAQRLGLPVILVVGLRLGCLNHALLTAEAIAARGLRLAGWVGNVIDADMPFLGENVTTLRQRLKAPCLGVVPRLAAARAAATYLELPAC